jgi:hypothetical protein
MKNVRNMLAAAVALPGYSFMVGSEGEVDYKGTSVRQGIAALEQLDEGYVTVLNERGYRCGSAMIVPDLDEDEMIADAGGWCNEWLDENIEY